MAGVYFSQMSVIYFCLGWTMSQWAPDCTQVFIQHKLQMTKTILQLIVL